MAKVAKAAQVVRLSTEQNRLLGNALPGNALLDSYLQRQLLGAERAVAMAGYALSERERRVTMAISARTLHELAAECCAVLGQPDELDGYVDAETMCRNYGIKPYPAEMVKAMVNRLAYTEPIYVMERLAGQTALGERPVQRVA
jgi:hypothetical protein